MGQMDPVAVEDAYSPDDQDPEPLPGPRAAKPGRLRAAVDYFDRRIWAYALVIPSLFMVGAVIVYPMVSGILMSFQDIRLLRPAAEGFIGLEHYRYLFTDRVARAALANTGVWVFGGVAVQLVLGMIAALLLNMKFRFVGLARLLVMLPFFMPPVVTAHMWALMLNARLVCCQRTS